jgi:adenylate cyclase
MHQRRVTTVLLAELIGKDEFLRAAGPIAGSHWVLECMERLKKTAQSAHGKVVKVDGNGLMMLFQTPDDAASAASRMHAAVSTSQAVGGKRLSVRVGYHAGPVVEACDDLLGDTVKLAAAALRRAQRGQTMTTPETANLLSETSRSGTELAAPPRTAARAASMLLLRYGGVSATCWRDNHTVVVGRSSSCGLVVANGLASRRHCTVFLTKDGFRIRDHSANGTYVTNDDAGEIVLWDGDESPLGARGWISFGRSRGRATELLEFSSH